ncbi:MAG: S8/S53 family peptidase, partial [Lachnospiraceae bacterium]|nr:S8/S53 family peptidase [Lachnospiraceae bacterium]
GATYGTAPLGVAPKATIYNYAAVTTEDDRVTGGDAYEGAFQAALADNVDIIAVPAGGLSYYDKQYPYILEAIKRGIPVVIAHANAKSAIDKRTRPAVYKDAQGKEVAFDNLPTADAADEICYWPGLITVQAVGESGTLQRSSRIQDSGVDLAAPGPDVMMEFYEWGHFEAQGGGCSCASTLTAGYMALAMQKWPQATGNQIMHLTLRAAHASRTGDKQVLTATAQKDLSALSRDMNTGHGIVNLDYMLATNPAVYPDYNPVLYKDIEQIYKNAVARNATGELKSAWITAASKELSRQLKVCGEPEPQFLQEILGTIGTSDVAQATTQNLPLEGAQGPGDLGSAPTEAERRQVSPKGTDEVSSEPSATTLISDGRVPTTPHPSATQPSTQDLPLEGKVAPKVTDEVSSITDNTANTATTPAEEQTGVNPILRFAALVIIAALLAIGAYITYGKKK